MVTLIIIYITDFNSNDDDNVVNYIYKCLGKSKIMEAAFFFIVMQLYLFNKNKLITLPIKNYELLRIINDSG